MERTQYANDMLWTQIENLQFEKDALQDEDLDFDALAAGIERVAEALNVSPHWAEKVILAIEEAAGIKEPA